MLRASIQNQVNSSDFNLTTDTIYNSKEKLLKRQNNVRLENSTNYKNLQYTGTSQYQSASPRSGLSTLHPRIFVKAKSNYFKEVQNSL